MDLISEYLAKKLNNQELEAELARLAEEYNKLRNTYLLIYAGNIVKPVPDIALSMDDYYQIYAMLKDVESSALDFYIETPGGSGEAAEEIVRFLRTKFENVNFVVSGESKSAGTLIVLSGDEIWMSNSGSLGPIDAQVRIGRTTISAFDYMEWITEKYDEANKNKVLNPLDATMIAQISPGELKLVFNALKFAEDLVVKWLSRYKFKNWTFTETRGKQVTKKMRKDRASKIVDDLINHGRWRSHGRSIKIEDLEDIGLRINRIDDDKHMAEIVYRIQTVIRLLFANSNTYKLFVTQDGKTFKNANPVKTTNQPLMKPDVVDLEIKCEKCGKIYHYYKNLKEDKQIPELDKKGYSPIPEDDKIVCECGKELDLVKVHEELKKLMV